VIKPDGSIDIAAASAPTLPGKALREAIAERPLPGAIILVHGVNSTGEWFEQAEEGLCAGLAKRLGLKAAEIPGYRPVRYRSEYKTNGEIDTDLQGDNFIVDAGRSPIIRFRYGFRASDHNISTVRATIMLNDVEAWGGGPFQNGTTSVPDLWIPGLNDRMFLWLHTQHMMGDMPGRQLFECPPRAYFAHAARRLALLVKTIRERDKHCPVTIVCHSQGNIIGIAASFFGQYEYGGEGVADTYVLSNPPYSLHSLGLQEFTQSNQFDERGYSGDVSTADRLACFREFVSFVRARRGKGPSVTTINNERRVLSKSTSEVAYRMSDAFPSAGVPAGALDRDNRGRVFLYANPHDQIIGATPVKGIGWRGVESKFVEIKDESGGAKQVSPLKQIDAAGDTFHQRVWAQGFKVGDPAKRSYHYLRDHYDPAAKQSPKRFWFPEPPAAKFKLTFTPTQGAASKVLTVLGAPVMWAVTSLYASPFNEPPPTDHEVLLNAPALPEPFEPRTTRSGAPGGAGIKHRDFDEAKDKPNRDFTDAERAEATRSEAYKAQLQEYRARTRMAAEAGEDGMKSAKDLDQRAYNEQTARGAEKRLHDYNAEEGNATDHGTILTNPMHHEKCTAYDVAVGFTWLTANDWQELHEIADWRYVPSRYADSYYRRGLIHENLAVDIAYPAQQVAQLHIPARRNNPPIAEQLQRAAQAGRRGDPHEPPDRELA
jgi:Protein of unknown function (DUF3274)